MLISAGLLPWRIARATSSCIIVKGSLKSLYFQELFLCFNYGH